MADGCISQITLPDNSTYLLKDSNALPLNGGSLSGGLEVKGHIKGDSSGTTGHGLYSGGGYHKDYNNIILHGDTSTGTSGIAFVSDKIASDGTITNINAPSDRAFIQYHANGITTTTAEGTAPTLATTGEAGRLVIGIGNDSGDKILLQAPGNTDILHQKGATGYPIPHTTNTNGSVGGTTTPVYVEAGEIKAGTALGGAAYKAVDYYALTSHTHTTANFTRPNQLNGINDITLQSLVSSVRANRLAFLPASQIIIENTTDGGATWTDAGITDTAKTGLFSEQRPNISIPKINNEKNINCGVRITFTAMRYDVPEGTAETQKYNYWNANYLLSTERYCQLKEFYFWVNATNDGIQIKIERATGANPNNWVKIFENTNWAATGWSGNDYIRVSQSTFGGGTTQTGNYWNYRITCFTRNNTGGTTLATSSTTSGQAISEIRGYGDTWWVRPNNYMAEDHLYRFDDNQNAIFPAAICPAVTNTQTLGSSSYKWSNVYATTFTGNLTGNASGTASNITGILALANFTKGAANTALMGKGTSSNPAYVSVSPSISITDGTSTAAPKINLTVLGISGTAQDLTIASTSAYGVTKLYDGVNSSSTEMAATAKAVKTAYDKAVNIIAESNALVYKGTIDGNESANNGGAYTVAANCGDVYIASTAGYVNGLYVELGDMLICNTDETVQANSSNYTTIRNKWDIIQTSNGTVSTSETSVAEGEIPVFKGTTGRFIQNSEKSFTTNAPTSSSGDSTIPTSKAVWTTVNTAITGLDVAAAGGGTGEYVSKISQADGKISATISTTSVSNTWTAGTTAGPTIKTTVNGITGTAVAIPSASNTASGIVTTGNQTFAGIKTFANTTASTSTDTGAVLVSGGLGVTGQVTATRLAANGNNTSYNLYVNGTSLLNGNTTINGNLVPGANNTKTLGSTDAKWSKLYVGSSESYGNAYQPVYWNDGVPAVSYPVQYSTWSISSGDNTATLTGTDIFTADTYVISLVVTSGEQYLNGPITWTSAANTLTLSTAATSGDVEGYVLTSIGTATSATCVSSSVTT